MSLEEVIKLIDKIWNWRDFRTLPEKYYNKEISKLIEKHKTTRVFCPEEYNNKYNSFNIIFYLDKNSNWFIWLFNKDFKYV